MTTFAEWTTLINNQLPVEVYFEQTTMEEWAAMVNFIPGLGMELAQMWSYCEKVGYFGGHNGGTRIITDLKLETEPTRMDDFVRTEDWSVLLKN